MSIQIFEVNFLKTKGNVDTTVLPSAYELVIGSRVNYIVIVVTDRQTNSLDPQAQESGQFSHWPLGPQLSLRLNPGWALPLGWAWAGGWPEPRPLNWLKKCFDCKFGRRVAWQRCTGTLQNPDPPSLTISVIIFR